MKPLFGFTVLAGTTCLSGYFIYKYADFKKEKPSNQTQTPLPKHEQETTESNQTLIESNQDNEQLKTTSNPEKTNQQPNIDSTIITPTQNLPEQSTTEPNNSFGEANPKNLQPNTTNQDTTEEPTTHLDELQTVEENPQINPRETTTKESNISFSENIQPPTNPIEVESVNNNLFFYEFISTKVENFHNKYFEDNSIYCLDVCESDDDPYSCSTEIENLKIYEFNGVFSEKKIFNKENFQENKKYLIESTLEIKNDWIIKNLWITLGYEDATKILEGTLKRIQP